MKDKARMEKRANKTKRKQKAQNIITINDARSNNNTLSNKQCEHIKDGTMKRVPLKCFNSIGAPGRGTFTIHDCFPRTSSRNRIQKGTETQAIIIFVLFSGDIVFVKITDGLAMIVTMLSLALSMWAFIKQTIAKI